MNSGPMVNTRSSKIPETAGHIVFKRATAVASERDRPAADGRLTIGVVASRKNRKSSEASAQVYRWRRDYGGPKLDQAKRLKDVERENVRLKKAVSELIGQADPEEALEGKY